MLYLSEGGIEYSFTPQEISELTHTAFEKLGAKKKVLIIPPDSSRSHSQAGLITREAFNYYRLAVSDIMPATGTHLPMTDSEIRSFFGDIPQNLFRVHNWRSDTLTIGEVPADYITEISGIKTEKDWPAQINRLAVSGGYDLILSIGQVVPHEVAGMANHSKNLLVGTGGPEAINRSHYIGALYGLERIMGLADTPVRKIFNYAAEHYLKNLPIVYIQTVVAVDQSGKTSVKGLFIGDDIECFEKAAKLSAKVNITQLDKKINRAVVYLSPETYKSTWIGNKAIYRSRMAIEDGGELTVIAPGVSMFGEDPEIDRLIRKYGYRGTEAVLDAVSRQKELQENLGTAAHLIHGSSENRFRICYAAGKLDREEIESVGYTAKTQAETEALFSPQTKEPGLNTDINGEEFYLIKNPAIGLWKAN